MGVRFFRQPSRVHLLKSVLVGCGGLAKATQLGLIGDYGPTP